MTVTLRNLRAFATVAQEMHFGRAAARLRIAQPNLSALIRSLEDELSVKLLRRKPRVELTAAGESLLAGAGSIFREVDAAIERVRMTRDGEIGAVRVGFASTAMLTGLPDILRRFRQDHPGIDLQLREMHSATQWEALHAGAVDVAITREVRPDRAIASTVLVRERFIAVLPKAHTLARQKSIAVRQLGGEPFIICRRAVAPALYDQIIKVCTEGGFAPRIEQETDEWHTALGFVRGGFGVAIAPEGLAQLRWRGVVFRPLRDASVQGQLHLCWSNERASPATMGFVDAVRRT